MSDDTAPATNTPPPTDDPATPVAIGEQEQQLLNEDPSLAMEIEQQEQQAQVAEQEDPAAALQINDALEEQVISDIAVVDPQLAEALQEEADVPGTPQEVDVQSIQTATEWNDEQNQFEQFDASITGSPEITTTTTTTP
jgi:hypothetical protein